MQNGSVSPGAFCRWKAAWPRTVVYHVSEGVQHLERSIDLQESVGVRLASDHLWRQEVIGATKRGQERCVFKTKSDAPDAPVGRLHLRKRVMGPGWFGSVW